jgi:hypothetical protein
LWLRWPDALADSVLPVANPTFRQGWPICIGPTFCLASLLYMSTGNSQLCHVSHNHVVHIGVACGQVLAKESLPPPSTCFIVMCAHFALLCTCCQLTCVGIALIKPHQHFFCPIACVLDCRHPSLAPPSPSSKASTQGPSL